MFLKENRVSELIMAKNTLVSFVLRNLANVMKPVWEYIKSMLITGKVTVMPDFVIIIIIRL